VTKRPPLGGQTLANRQLGDRRKCIGRTNLAGFELVGAKDIPSVSATAGLRPARARVFRQNAAACRSRAGLRAFLLVGVFSGKISCGRHPNRSLVASRVTKALAAQNGTRAFALMRRIRMPSR
jgi:hypothetical protein